MLFFNQRNLEDLDAKSDWTRSGASEVLQGGFLACLVGKGYAKKNRLGWFIIERHGVLRHLLGFYKPMFDHFLKHDFTLLFCKMFQVWFDNTCSHRVSSIARFFACRSCS